MTRLDAAPFAQRAGCPGPDGVRYFPRVRVRFEKLSIAQRGKSFTPARYPTLILKSDDKVIDKKEIFKFCGNHFGESAGFAGSAGFASFGFTSASSTRFLKSPRSSCSQPLKLETTCSSHPVPLGTSVT